ncbi:MAG: NINE protein [Gammaproteobacteria bacterium]|nr:NINE protein [Gammaproteobacteria bacterium]MDH5691638.1 NINE protein [Gammaproteobacteria bacterium]
MKDNWKTLDLEGGGVQTINLQFIRLQKRSIIAYLMWPGFFLGLHRFYLAKPLSATIYLLFFVVLLLLISVFNISIWFMFLELPFALYDLFWIPTAVTAYNKALRIKLYSQSAAAPPAGYQGRRFATEQDTDLIKDYINLKDKERAGVGGTEVTSKQQIPTLAQQEKLLRALQKKKD